MASRLRERAQVYYRLAKPGIVYGNSIAAIAGFLLASATHGFDPWRFLALLIGTSLVIGSACVANNYLDRDIDRHMERTKKRALVQGTISGRQAFVYAMVLGVTGVSLLVLFTNMLTAVIGLIGFIFYVVIYGIAKRKTPYSTLIGSIPGAVPPAAGYVAVTNQLDSAAILLFLILTIWQMPHFYAIAMRRAKDYAAAGLPVLSVVRSPEVVRRHIVVYIGLFIFITPFLSVFGYTGLVYAVGTTFLGGYWLGKALKNWQLPHEKWAKQVFVTSLFVLLAQSALISVGALLP